MRKCKATLTLNKSAYIRMCILNLSNSVMITSKVNTVTTPNYYLPRLIVSFIIYEIKTEDVFSKL